MQTETDQPTTIDATAAFDGIVALLDAAGLTDDQIEAVTGQDAGAVRSRVEDAAEPPARELSVIERARMAMEARAAQR